MSKTTRSLRVQVSLLQRDAGSFSANSLMSQEIVIPADLPSGKILAVVGNLIEGMVTTVEIVHGPVPSDPEEEITAEARI